MDLPPLKISIVMPSFNQARYLTQALDSVLSQDYQRCELIVIDGGSTDGSVDILKRYEDRLAYWSSEPDAGQSQALNKGFRLASGDVIGWLNSDDTYQPGTFDQVAGIFADETVNIAMCSRFGMMDGEGTLFRQKENWFADHDTLVRYWTTNGMTINQPSVFIRRKVLESMNPVLDESLHYAMDYDLWLRITQTHRVDVFEGHWANYRFHDSSKSGLGFEKFFPEWKRVSRRFWGKPWAPKWWRNAISYLYHRYPVRLKRALMRNIKGTATHG